MDAIYINKTKQIMNTGRLKEEYMTRDEKINFHNELAAAVSGLKKLWLSLSLYPSVCFMLE